MTASSILVSSTSIPIPNPASASAILSSTLTVPQNTFRNPHRTAMRRSTTKDTSFFIPRRPAPPAPKRLPPPPPQPPTSKPKRPLPPPPPPTPLLPPLPTPPLGLIGPDTYFPPLPLYAPLPLNPLLVSNIDLSSYLPTPFLPVDEKASYDPLQHYLTETGSVVERLFTLHDYISATTTTTPSPAPTPAAAENARGNSTDNAVEEDEDGYSDDDTSIALSDSDPCVKPSQPRLGRTRKRMWSRRGSALLRRVTRHSGGNERRFRESERCGLGGLWEV
jgi:hypothetical protein